ncbi:hypothetical protein BX666DRAFT_381709 [Dichotomocladium elegans]|nr:hypothetical protein BX666DRAFT_381709 [Dichotomocladium elegans]
MDSSSLHRNSIASNPPSPASTSTIIPAVLSPSAEMTRPTSVLQQNRPMSISAITTTAAPIFPPSPPPSANNKSSSRYFPYEQLPQLGSPPTSPEDFDFSSPPASPYPHSNPVPLTLQERRMRNKAASAKYRQKKNQQQNDMRQLIIVLSEKKAVLERQVQELRIENERLRADADNLRGKMVAQKMLRQWMNRYSHQKGSSAFRAVSKNPRKSNGNDACDEDDFDLDFDDDVGAPE